jgi:tetratricopeptide (TPR) repeat protein
MIGQQSLEDVPPSLEAILEAAAYRLVQSDPALAATFIDEAEDALRRTCAEGSRHGTCGKSEKHIAKARSALASAESALSADDFAGVARNCALSLKAIEKAQSKTRDFDAVQIQAALNEALVVAAEAGCWENDADADGDCRKAWAKISGARALLEQGDRDFAIGATSEAAERYRKAHQHISKALEKLREEG